MYTKFIKVNSTKIAPMGWLKDQLELQANGLTGHLEEIWKDVGPDSAWLGGTGESWERGPYYLDGLVPLAYYLKDENLIAKSKKWIEWTLNSQTETGFFGPSTNKDHWPRMVMLKVLIQYYDFTNDLRVIEFMKKYFKYQLDAMKDLPLYDWAAARGFENTYCIAWLYNITKENYLLELINIIEEQTFDWNDFFENFKFKKPTKCDGVWEEILTFFEARETLSSEAKLEAKKKYHFTHIVNIAMATKKPAVDYLLTGDKKYKDIIYKGIDSLMEYHGRANGMWSGDEHLNGNDPARGNELCAVVEYMFSLGILGEIFGDVNFFDLLEKIAYNDLPATISEDFTTHQYLQQVNQIGCTVSDKFFHNNEKDANIFGFEPNFGCCTANMHQGWPKFVSNLWMEDNDGSLVSTVIAPSTINIDRNGVNISITCLTDYPFKDTVKYIFASDKQVEMKFKFRIPNWSNKQTIKVNNELVQGSFKDYYLVERTFTTGDVIELDLHSEFKTSYFYNNSLAVEKGALVYSLPVEEKWVKFNYPLKSRVEPFVDYEIYPNSTWNYALHYNYRSKELPILSYKENALEKQPFNSKKPPIQITLKASLVNGWTNVNDNTTHIPASPLEPRLAHLSGCETAITLIPYGATKLRITQFPWYINR